MELQALFDAADDDVVSIRGGPKKGWAPAFRDATMLKVTYAWGLRRREIRMLEVSDFGPNPMAAEFGDYGVCGVRFGKAAKGGPPRRRGVLTVFGWSTDVLLSGSKTCERRCRLRASACGRLSAGRW